MSGIEYARELKKQKARIIEKVDEAME